MPKILNKYHHGLPKGSRPIGRDTIWGNRFIIGRHGERDEVIAKHAYDLACDGMLFGWLDDLRGYDLVCFCTPKACHGDLLLMLANATQDEREAWRAQTLLLPDPR